MMIGIVLAGGSASRMGGGDKGDRTVGGVAIIERVLATLAQQCDSVLLSANGDPARFEHRGAPVVADDMPSHPGPLAGILSGLDAVACRFPTAAFAVTVPVDAPFLPSDLVARLLDRRVADRAAVVCAASADRIHRATALWAVSLRHDLRRALSEDGVRRVGDFLARHPTAHVTWPTTPLDPFFNVNTPDDLAEAERLHRSYGSLGSSLL